jgi:two-component system OmpR family response regulator
MVLGLLECMISIGANALSPISTIQIVESNPNLGSLLGWHLQQIGYTVFQSVNAQQTKLTFAKQQPQLIVLDTELPDGDGIELCKWLYRQNRVLIFLISSRTSESDIVAGLKAGADDYLTKPFGIHEFLARVEALTRRVGAVTFATYLDYGQLKIDLIQRQVYLKGNIIDLTPQEFSLLYVLTQAEGGAISRADLLQRAWPEEITNPRTVDTHILSLRKKIELDPQQPSLIKTVRNVGYRFNIEFLARSHREPNNSQTKKGANNTLVSHSRDGERVHPQYARS